MKKLFFKLNFLLIGLLCGASNFIQAASSDAYTALSKNEKIIETIYQQAAQELGMETPPIFFKAMRDDWGAYTDGTSIFINNKDLDCDLMVYCNGHGYYKQIALHELTHIQNKDAKNKKLIRDTFTITRLSLLTGSCFFLLKNKAPINRIAIKTLAGSYLMTAAESYTDNQYNIMCEKRADTTAAHKLHCEQCSKEWSRAITTRPEDDPQGYIGKKTFDSITAQHNNKQCSHHASIHAPIAPCNTSWASTLGSYFTAIKNKFI